MREKDIVIYDAKEKTYTKIIKIFFRFEKISKFKYYINC